MIFWDEYLWLAQDIDVTVLTSHKFPLPPLPMKTKQNIAYPAVPFGDRQFNLGRAVEAAAFPRVTEVSELHEAQNREIPC